MNPAEESEFNFFNCYAFALARERAKKDDTILPAWLCASEEARSRWRDEAVAYLQETAHLSRPEATRLLEEGDTLANGGAPVEQWREAELTLKQLRAEGNPRAFFFECA